MEPNVTLVVGGARSGKSMYAQKLACTYAEPRVFMATAEPFDDEMKLRISHHRRDREGLFERTVEEPVHLEKAYLGVPKQTAVILIDCLTVWVGNLMYHHGPDVVNYQEIDEFLNILHKPSCPTIIVTNEVGQGIVPPDKDTRLFRDIAGRLNQQVAALADTVVMMVCGIPMVVKGETECVR